jgi:hypothetical protein
MKKNEKNYLTANDVASELELIASKLRKGKFSFAGQDLTIKDVIDFKQKQRLDGGMIRYEISLRLPTIASSCFNLEKSSGENFSQRESFSKRSYQDKLLKKKINNIWKGIVNNIKERTVLSAGSVTELKENCKLYGETAPAQWQKMWQECAELMYDSCSLAVEGKYDHAEKLIEKIKQYKKNAHKKFK